MKSKILGARDTADLISGSEMLTMALLQTFISGTQNRPSLAVFQSSVAQTTIPVLRQFLATSLSSKGGTPRHRIVFCLLYSPSSLVESTTFPEIEVHDWLDNVPGYSPEYFKVGPQLLSTLDQALNAHSGPLDVILDSIDTLLSDVGSLSETYRYLREAHTKLAARAGSTVVLHGTRTDLISLVTQTSFSSSLVHIKGHPTAILNHLSVEYLTPPPPLSPEPKFWSVFLPLSQRQKDVNDLVFGSNGEGSGDSNEIVIEVLVRGVAGRKRNVDRELEAWSLARGPCEWQDLEALKSIWVKQAPAETPASADPTQNLSFNLNLTSAQQEARASVPLPYAHEGQPVEKASAETKSAIYYDPDSADDLDDDDPDEDLEI